MSREATPGEHREPVAGGEGIYLFCLARRALLPAVEGSGLDDRHPLFLETFGEVVAVLSAVDLEGFCGAGAEARMKDLKWVGPRACRHQEVIEQAMRYSPVLPARFGTLFSSLDVLAGLLEASGEAVDAFLEEVAGREEWSLKGMMEKERAAAGLLDAAMGAQAAELASLSPGKRYFQEQRIRAGVEKGLKAWLRDVAQVLREDLAGLGAEVAPRRLLSREATGHERDMVLNWAVLLPREALGAFEDRVERANRDWADRGLAFETSGPWPAYSFAPVLEIEGSS